MDAVPKSILREAHRRKPVYALKIPLLYALMGLAGFTLFQTQDHRFAIPIGVACSVLIAYVIRGLGAIAHDVVHGNLTRNKTAAYWLSLCCWSPTGMSVTIYRNYHLHHHKITNEYTDVDNFVVTDYTRNPVLAKLLLLVVYTGAYPLYWAIQMTRYTKRLSRWELIRMNLELLMIGAVIVAGFVLMPLQVFVFFFGLPFLIGAFLASSTSMVEHFLMEDTTDNAYSSRTYGTRCHITNFLWNNVTYHNEHHKFPGIPFYNLASFHRKAYPYYDDKVKSEVHTSIYPLMLKLYWRILTLDVAALDAKYAALDLETERARDIKVPGIPAGTSA
ncbi:MAG: fatty acid desaturase [Myxococcota bacterium]